MPNQSGNQEIYEVMTDHTSSNEIQVQQHENEEIIQLTNEIHVPACSNENETDKYSTSTSDDEYLPVNTKSSSESEQLNDDDDCDNGNEYYEIKNTHPEHIQQLPVYPIDNHIVELSEDDEAGGWKVEQNDVNLWPCRPFLVHPSTIIDVIPPLKPETFFDALFDDRMWNLISESTNLYAASKSRNENGKSTKYINISNYLLLSN